MELAKSKKQFEGVPLSVVANSIRSSVEEMRHMILGGLQGITEDDLCNDRVLDLVSQSVQKSMTPNLKYTINGTGVVVHTNLGRSLLAPTAVENIATTASHYSNLEYDLATGKRGSRYSHVEDILCELTGAESALVVNNNAGAVLLSLETIARNKKVIVSRGELVEIGGSFRIPDVMLKSGGILAEVGTTNRTHLKDYENAIDSDTALLLKVHRSNFSVVGFTKEVSLAELVDLGSRHSIPVMEDLGSGTFIDFSKYGLEKEATVRESVAAGIDVITFSGDKLLGGPQAGIIIGKKDIIDHIKKNPINRALRIDKLTLAALESTLRLYRDEETALSEIPTLRMLTENEDTIAERADRLVDYLQAIGDTRLQVQQTALKSKAGGGALPLLELPSRCIKISADDISVNTIEKYMRANAPPIIGRIEEDRFILDLRTIQDDELNIIKSAFAGLLERISR